ncbi:MAG TPA: hypothetical protein VIX17_22835 [Pyrinomonadaceae bacterium]|jgi:hypothetical protein
MTRRLIALTAILAFLIVLQAQTPKTTTLDGYIIDNACAGNLSKAPTFGEKVKVHKTSCALMPSCVTSGYAVFTADGKLYKLDKAGNEQVEALLKDTQKTEGLQVQVEGSVDGDTIKVSKVTEKTE